MSEIACALKCTLAYRHPKLYQCISGVTVRVYVCERRCIEILNTRYKMYALSQTVQMCRKALYIIMYRMKCCICKFTV